MRASARMRIENPVLSRVPISRNRVERPAHDHGALAPVPPIVHNVLRSAGAPPDMVTSAFMKPRFGHDFGRVRVHTNEKAAKSAWEPVAT